MLTAELIKTGGLNQTDLQSEDSYVVGTEEAGVWVWLGISSSQVKFYLLKILQCEDSRT